MKKKTRLKKATGGLEPSLNGAKLSLLKIRRRFRSRKSLKN
jgi:hypothetical protein